VNRNPALSSGALSLASALLVYAVAVLAVGAAASRRAGRSPEAFLVGDRGFGRLMTWAAISSTTIGGSTTLVLAALVAAKGLAGLWLDLAGVAGLAFLGLFLAGRVRATGALTLAEVIGTTYGPRVRRVAALLIVLAEIVWFALLTQATEAVVTAATPWPSTRVLVATAAVFVAYTALGGQRAVVGTDLLQFALMAAALLGIAFPAALLFLGRAGLPASARTFPFGPALGPMDAAALLVLVGLPHAVGSDVWAKLLSAKDGPTARAATLWAAGSKLAFGLAVATIALAGIAAGLPGGPALFPRAVLALCGPALAPLLFVAMIATMQSSSDSVLLSAAAATGHDLFPGGTGPHRLRGFVVLHGFLGLMVALWLRDLVETFRLGYTLFASGLILPTLAGFSRRIRVDERYAAAAMILGGGTAMAVHFLRPKGIDPVLAGTGLNAAVLALGLRRPRRT
jgi:solute:Na+ symporter, SSS family